ncbi:MAG: hypothetical protein IMZ75_00080 [Actinobacteria bacterium]|nr:hypothetical protein [Actinomycetota bacterium]
MSAWTAVLDDVGARGGTPAQVATRLGLPISLVRVVLDHAERLGVVVVAGQGCGSGCPTGPAMPKGCVGCPLSLP